MEKGKERIDRIEEAIIRLISIQQKTEMELQEFKNEMKEFKNEMKEFKNEMKEFKIEMEKFKDRMEKEVKRINKQWGELANKMGTIVEDIVFPAVRPVIKKYFKCEPRVVMTNVTQKNGSTTEEFDIVAICDDKTFLIEVKSTLRFAHISQMRKKVEKFKKLFPEFCREEVIPILASLKISEQMLNRLTKEGIYAMAYREWEYMDILNFEEIRKRKQKNK